MIDQSLFSLAAHRAAAAVCSLSRLRERVGERVTRGIRACLPVSPVPARRKRGRGRCGTSLRKSALRACGAFFLSARHHPRIRRSDRGLLPRQADQHVHPRGAGRQLRRLFARARPPSHALHPGQSAGRAGQHAGRRRARRAQLRRQRGAPGRHRADHDHAVVSDGPGAADSRTTSRWTCARSTGSAT